MNISRLGIKLSLLILFSMASALNAQLSYVPQDNLRDAIRIAQWTELKPQTPKKQRFLTGLVFGSNQCFQIFEDAARRAGHQPYELPTIAAFYQVVLEETIAGDAMSNQEVEHVYQTTSKQFQNQKPDKTMAHTNLQRVYDSLIIQAIWVATVFELSKKRSVEIQETAQGLLNAFSLEKLIGLNEEKSANTTLVASQPKESAPIQAKTVINTKTPLGLTDVIMRTVTNYGLNGVYIKNEVSVLFADGTIFSNPNEPLDALDAVISKRQNPKKWGKWQKNGSVLRVTKPWKNKSYDWKKWFRVRPAEKGQKIVGHFNSLDGFGGSTVINAAMVAFDSQGRFAWKTVKGGNTSWKPIYSKSASAGTYEIDDYKITLIYNNGVRESFFFGFYPMDDEHFVIGSSHFTPKK